MAHGTDKAVFGLGDGSDAPNGGPVTTGADNTIDALTGTQAELDAHTGDATDAHDASAVSVDSTGLVGVGTDVQTVLGELDDGIADHLADATDAHDASAVSVLDTAGDYAGTNVEAVLAEIADKGLTLFSSLLSDSADVNASEVLVDSGMTVTVAAGTYVGRCRIVYTTSANADLKLSISGTATVTAGDSYVLDTYSGTKDTFGGTTAFLGGASADTTYGELEFLLTVTVAGTVKLQFTQNTSDATNTHIDEGSFMLVQKVA